jgi:hypothetical protein
VSRSNGSFGLVFLYQIVLGLTDVLLVVFVVELFGISNLGLDELCAGGTTILIVLILSLVGFLIATARQLS